jgi:hypothetical protein
MSASGVRHGRIVVAFDPQRPDPAPLRLGLPLARSLSQALCALYVEEEDTLALGGFGCLATVSVATGAARPLSRESLERDFRRLERQARAAFTRVVAGAAAEFTTVRGRLTDELRRAGADASVVLTGRPADGCAGRGEALRVLDALLPLPAALAGLIASPRATATGLMLVLRPERFAHGDAARDPPLLAAAQEALAATGTPARRISGRGVTAAGLLPALRGERIGTLLIERGAIADERALIGELLSAWPGSLLVLRGDED